MYIQMTVEKSALRQADMRRHREARSGGKQAERERGGGRTERDRQ